MRRYGYVHPADQLADTMRRIYDQGKTTTSGGNLTLRDEDGSLWVTPAACDKGKLTRADILHVRRDGTVEGAHKPSSEFPFHSAVLKARPELNAVLHAHSQALVAYSFTRKAPPAGVLPRVDAAVGKIEVAPYQRPGSEALAQSVARVFADGGSAAILENHGVAVGGADLQQALDRFEQMERLAKICTTARLAGGALRPAEGQAADVRAQIEQKERFVPGAPSAEACDARSQVAEWARRAYRLGHCTAFTGCFAMRVSEDSFVITPQDIDRRDMRAEDAVLVSRGRIEEGKQPDEHVLLAEAVFAKNPETRGLAVADPCGIMAFAVSGLAYQVATIPESYMMLEQLGVAAYGAWQNDPEGLAAELTPRHPAMLVKNDCLIVTGTTVFNTFDRIEVCEFTGQSILQAQAVGQVVPLTQAELAALDKMMGRQYT